MKPIQALVAAIITAFFIVTFSFILVRGIGAMDDLRSISTDLHAIRESLAPPAVKIKFRYGPSKITPAPKKIILA